MTSIDLMSTDIMSADPVAGILDLMAAALLVVAALLTLAAAIGLWRLPTRCRGSTRAPSRRSSV